jgi:hypothetical protein
VPNAAIADRALPVTVGRGGDHGELTE